MGITKQIDENRAVITLSGRLDAETSSELKDMIEGLGEEITALLLDFEKLEYVSSMGLRIILIARKRFPGDALVLRKVRPAVMEILGATGFVPLLTFEE